MVIGANTRLEIWDAQAWETYLAAQEDSFSEAAEEVLPGILVGRPPGCPAATAVRRVSTRARAMQAGATSPVPGSGPHEGAEETRPVATADNSKRRRDSATPQASR